MLVAGAVAILIVLAAKGLIAAVIVLAVMVVMNQLEGHLLQPQVVGKMVRLHPLAVILVLAVGGVVAGHRRRGGGRPDHRRADQRDQAAQTCAAACSRPAHAGDGAQRGTAAGGAHVTGRARR